MQKFTISDKKTILDALTQLNELSNLSRNILFVENDSKEIIGSITDGDIRRALLKHADLSLKISDFYYENFTYSIYNNEFINLSRYKNPNVKMLPLLNEDKTLNRVVDLEKTTAILPMECMIMAGGRGKRLSPLTDSIPKPMLPLGDKPIIEYNIDRLIKYGVKKIYISVKYLGEKIQEYFGDGASKGIEIEYIWENKPLGTAGALALVEKFSTDRVLLMNSDLFTNVNFEEMYLKSIQNDADMVIASTEYKVDVPYAVFESEGNQIKGFKEKPSYVYHSNAGIYILKRELIDKIPKNEFYDITDLMDHLVETGGKLIHDPIKGYWIDIGKPVDYKNAQEFIKYFSV